MISVAYGLREELIESSSAEDLKVPVDEKLDVSQQSMLAACEANCLESCTRRGVASRLLCSALVRPCWSTAARAWLLEQERCGTVGVGLEEATKVISYR